MRCFWIPRPRATALAAAPARTVRRTIIATAATAAPRAVPAVRRTAGLVLVCVAGAMPAFELLRYDVGTKPVATASAAAATPQAATTPRDAGSTPAFPPPPVVWFAETGVASPPRPPVPMPSPPLAFPPPFGGPPPPGPKPRDPQPTAGPPGPEPTPEGGDPFVLTTPPPGTAVPVPAAGALLLGALGFALLLVPAGRQTRPSA
jgi:hypothetical protein